MNKLITILAAGAVCGLFAGQAFAAGRLLRMRAGKIVQGLLPVEARGTAACMEREEYTRAKPDAAKRHRERTGARVGKGLDADSPRADRRKDRQNLPSVRGPMAARDRFARAVATVALVQCLRVTARVLNSMQHMFEGAEPARPK